VAASGCDAGAGRAATVGRVTDSASPRALVDEYLDWYFENYPIWASLAGADGFDDHLGDFSADGFERRTADSQTWLARLEASGPGQDADDAIDRDLLVSTLRGERIMAGWPAWRRDPATYLVPVFASLFNPFLHGLRPEAELVDSAVLRLGQVPDVLAACRANLDEGLASTLLVRRALGQASAGRAFVTESLPSLVTDEALRGRLADASGPAAEAFDATVAFLTDLTERATGDWRMGEERYSALLREREMLGYGAAELHRRGLDAWAELDAEMTELAARADPDAGDWRTAIERLSEDHPPTVEAMREEYEAETERARKFLVEHALVTLPEGESCRVVPSPPFQRPLFAVAFYIAPPPLTTSRLGHFFVPYTPDGYTPDQVRDRLRSNSRPQQATTSVHEAYPGHHWHLSWMADTPRTVRRIFRTPYFAEGWALYAERLMREHGYFTSVRQELAHLEARIFRAARIVADTALHTMDMTVAQAEEYMSTQGTLNHETAVAEVNRYCAWPTQAPSYLTGCLEIERIRADFLAAGHGGVREFNDRLAGSGSLPLGLARRAVLGDS
jgi:uncharacterized protein (DUF885 family)